MTNTEYATYKKENYARQEKSRLHRQALIQASTDPEYIKYLHTPQISDEEYIKYFVDSRKEPTQISDEEYIQANSRRW